MGSQPTLESLSADIDEIREQVKWLSARKAALQTAILSDPSSVSRIREAATTDSELEEFDNSVAHCKHAIAVAMERICAGKSLFDAKHEGPLTAELAEHDGAVVGVRLERFDTANQRFLDPSYIFLTPKDLKSAADDLTTTPLKVIHHNLPDHVDVAMMEQTHLSGPNTEIGAIEQKRLINFVQACQYLLMQPVKQPV